MNRSIQKTLKKYDNFSDTFVHAYVGFPKGFGGIPEAFYGTFDAFHQKYPDINIDKKYKTLLYMHGSSGLNKGDVYRKQVVEELGFVFFAPNSHQLHKRPVYRSPAKQSLYLKVHKVRIAELYYNYKKLKALDFVDTENIFLMGNSEGGLTAAAFRSNKFRGRIVTAFSCESSYFYEDFTLGSKKSEPFLNIIGTEDEYFAKDSIFNQKYHVTGNGIKSLENHKNAKVVILSRAKHDLTSNIYVKDEIIGFLRLWQKG